jgi:hypothetical protein
MKAEQVLSLPPSALMTDAASTSETSVNLYQTTRRNNPENSHLDVTFWLVKPQETRLQGELGLDARETVRV